MTLIMVDGKFDTTIKISTKKNRKIRCQKMENPTQAKNSKFDTKNSTLNGKFDTAKIFFDNKNQFKHQHHIPLFNFYFAFIF